MFRQDLYCECLKICTVVHIIQAKEVTSLKNKVQKGIYRPALPGQDFKSPKGTPTGYAIAFLISLTLAMVVLWMVDPNLAKTFADKAPEFSVFLVPACMYAKRET